MPFDRPTPQNQRAGVGVFVAIAVGGVLVWLGLWLQARGDETYSVTFTTEQGVYGLKVGTPVRVGGLVRGHVTNVAPTLEGSMVVGYKVDFALARQVVLYRGARILSIGSGVAGDCTVDILDTGRGRTMSGAVASSTAEPSRLQPKESIAAGEAEAFDGFVGPKPAVRLRALVAQVKDASAAIEFVYTDAPERLQTLRKDWNTLADAAREEIQKWRGQWAELSTRAEHAMATLGAGADGAPDAVVPVLRDAQSQFSQIDFTSDSRRLTMARTTLAKAIQTLDTIQAQAYAARSALNDADSGLGFATADFSIAGSELAAAKREVPRSFWRLFASPSQQQLAESERIEEARIFAQAASEFERSIEAMRQTLERDGDLLARSPGLAELLTTQITASTAKFDAAVAHFAELMLGPPGVAPSVAPSAVPSPTPPR